MTDIQICESPACTDYCFAFRKMLVCAVEAYTRRVSVMDFECMICHKKITADEKMDHILTCHSREFSEILQANLALLNDDAEDMTGFFGKLDFDGMIAMPKLGVGRVAKQGATIIAPPITTIEEPEAKELEPVPDLYFRYKGTLSPCLGRFLKKNAPIPPIPHIESKGNLDVDAANSVVQGLWNAFRKSQSSVSTKSLQPAAPPPLEKKELPRPQSTAPIPDKPKPPPTIHSSLDSVESPTKPPPARQKGRKGVTFLDTIPEQIRDQVIAMISTRMIRNFVDQQCGQIIRPVFTVRKKQYQKRVREQKLAKARLEEKQRITAMRERRQIAIKKFSEDVANPLIRAFVRAEITAILKDEAATVRDAVITDNIETRGNGNTRLPPVIVSGLVNRKHLSPQFIQEHFGSYKFALDDDGSPRIRFRFNGNRFDVLLYLTSLHDVNHLVAQRSFQVDYSIARLSLDTEQEDESIGCEVSYTGQNVNIVQSAKNLDDFSGKRGRSACDRMCPLICVDAVLDDLRDDGEVK
jgi:hypothetical protein